MRENDYQTQCFDFNIDLFDATDEATRKEYWSMSNHHFWDNPDMNALINDEIINDWIKRLLNSNIDIVGFSIYSSNYQITLILINKIFEQAPHLKIICGGPFTRMDHGIAQELLETRKVDAVTLGEGEDTLVELLDSYKNTGEFEPVEGALLFRDNKVVEGKKRKAIKIKDREIYPDFEGFDFHKYDGSAIPILSSRSCIYNCAFCNERTYWGAYRSRDAKQVFKEMHTQAKRYGRYEFVFCDLAINGDLKLLDELCDLILASGKDYKWRGYMLVRKMPRELILKMGKAGFLQHCVGIETGSPTMLKKMNKNFKISIAEQMLKDLYDAGIETHTSWIVGYPGETHEYFMETVDFVRRNKKYMKRVNPANVLNIPPGSPIALNPEKYGVTEIVNSLNWSDATSSAEEKEERARYFNKMFCSDEFRTFEKIQF